jgi:hypothetical protein
MKTKITKTFIRKVLSMRKAKWHDQQWHDFMNSTEAEAVEYGIREAAMNGFYIDLDDIKDEAEKYLMAQAAGLAANDETPARQRVA